MTTLFCWIQVDRTSGAAPGEETEYGADVGEDWPVARINAERYLALLAVVALGGWRIWRYMRGIRYINAKIRARKIRERQITTRISQK
jgi:hypothetical protein